MPAQRHAGRPRLPDTDATILRATMEMLADVGLSGLTVAGVAKRAGVARATIYLRWPSRDALLGAVAKAAAGGLPLPLSGELERDIRAASAFVQQVVGSAQFRLVMPELVRAVLARPPDVSFDALAPNRVLLSAQYERTADTAGFDPAVASTLAFDVLFGAALSHLLATGSGPSREYATQVAEVVLAGLRRRA